MKILVRGTNWIGDAVMSVPALRELRRIFPESHITLHTRSWAEGLFMDSDLIDELITYDPAKWKIKDVLDNSKFLKIDGYDLAILLPNSFESALTSFLTRIPRRFGYNKDVRGFLLTDPIAVPEWKGRKHEVFYYLNLIEQIERKMLGKETVSAAVPDISLPVSEDRRISARKRLSDAGADMSVKTVIIGAGSTNSMAKRWPVESFAKLNDRFRSELGVNTILAGSKDEIDVSQRLVSLCRTPPIDMTGKTDLNEAVALLSEADLLISNDMGLAHVAASVGTDVLTIFGPTDPETTRPYSQNADIIREAVDCSPCMLRECPIDHRCMTRITTDRVFESARYALYDHIEPEEIMAPH